VAAGLRGTYDLAPHQSTPEQMAALLDELATEAASDDDHVR
jgi:hypothetical protein